MHACCGCVSYVGVVLVMLGLCKLCCGCVSYVGVV